MGVSRNVRNIAPEGFNWFEFSISRCNLMGRQTNHFHKKLVARKCLQRFVCFVSEFGETLLVKPGADLPHLNWPLSRWKLDCSVKKPYRHVHGRNGYSWWYIEYLSHSKGPRYPDEQSSEHSQYQASFVDWLLC